MRERPLRPDPSDGDRAASLVEVRCPGHRTSAGGDRVPCRHVLKEVPSWWGRALTAIITSRGAWAGRGEVMRCRHCRLWVEITYQPEPA